MSHVASLQGQICPHLVGIPVRTAFLSSNQTWGQLLTQLEAPAQSTYLQVPEQNLLETRSAD